MRKPYRCKNTLCQNISRVSSVRYLGLIFGKNLCSNLHVNNLVMKLQSLNSSFYNLRHVVPIHTLSIVYLSIYQAIFQYGLLV